eukprot:sb/3468298/
METWLSVPRFVILHPPSRSVRQDAGKALGLLCATAPDYISTTVLPFLLDRLTTGDINARHGALYAIGNICMGLRNAGVTVPAGCVEKIGGVLGLLEERSSFKGSAGDEMRGAVCFFIEKVSDAGVVLGNLAQWQKFLDLCLVNPEKIVNVQDKAVSALRSFAALSYPSTSTTCPSDIVSRYTDNLFHEFVATRVGCALALSVLPAHLLKPCLVELVRMASEGTTVRNKGEKSLSQFRVACVEAVTHLVLVGEPNCEMRQDVYQVH